MLWHACVYVSNIKPMRLIEASLGIFMYFYANLPWLLLFRYIVYGCSNFSSSRIIQQMKGVFSISTYRVVYILAFLAM